MPSADSASHDIPSDDDIDAILNGVLDEDISKIGNAQAREPTLKPSKKAVHESGLGIDEEIKISKKRQPIPKLDENRLLSGRGIPKLQKIAKERLKFKGKGHEHGDIARMLNMYQLWLDDLYPRAKFADGLTMIEKLGHSKKIQVMRKAWINEGKPRNNADDYENQARRDELNEGTQGHTEQTEDVEMAGIPQDRNEQRESPSTRQESSGDITRTLVDEVPDEDELDALLAESAAPIVPAQLPRISSTDADDLFADDMEAMAGMDW